MLIFNNYTQVHLHNIRQRTVREMSRVCTSDTSGEGDSSGAGQPKRHHTAGGAGRGAVPRGEPAPGRRPPSGEEEEEENGEEGIDYNCIVQLVMCGYSGDTI